MFPKLLGQHIRVKFFATQCVNNQSLSILMLIVRRTFSFVLSVSVSQDSTDRQRVKDNGGEDQRDNMLGTAFKEARTRDIQMDLGLLPKWTLDEYRRECAHMMEVNRFDAMAAENRNHVIHERNRFDRDTPLGVWKHLSALIGRRCVGILVGRGFATRSSGLCGL